MQLKIFAYFYFFMLNHASDATQTFQNNEIPDDQKIIKQYYDNLKEEFVKIGYDITQPLMLIRNEITGMLEPADIQKLKLTDESVYDFKFGGKNLPIVQKGCFQKEYDPVKDRPILILSNAATKPKHIWASQLKCEEPVVPRIYSTTIIRPNEYCNVFFVGFQLKLDPKEPPELFSTASYCRNSMDTVYAIEYLISLDVMNEIKNFDTVDQYTLGFVSSFITKEEIDDIYSLDNQEKVFSNLLGKDYEKYFDRNHIHLEKQVFIDQRNHILPAYKLSALFYGNLAPMYASIRKGSWAKIEETIRTSLQGDYTAQILTGTRGVVELNDKKIFLKPKEHDVRVPEVFYKIITLQIGSQIRSIVIVTHNNPYQVPNKKICSEIIICENYGWPLSNINPREGYTYCCKSITFLRKDVTDVHFDVSEDILNLMTLSKLYQEEVDKATQR